MLWEVWETIPYVPSPHRKQDPATEATCPHPQAGTHMPTPHPLGRQAVLDVTQPASEHAGHHLPADSAQ